MDYKPLRKIFRSKGFTYEEVWREGDLAIYKQTSKHGTTHFEVIRIRRHNGYTIAGNQFPPAEMYPSNTQWGTLGWTCITWDDAQKTLEKVKVRFNENEPEPEITEEDLNDLATEDKEETDKPENEEPEEDKTPWIKTVPLLETLEAKEKTANQELDKKKQD